jgi:hypothetical protein
VKRSRVIALVDRHSFFPLLSERKYPVQVCLCLSIALVPFLLLSCLPYCITRLSLHTIHAEDQVMLKTFAGGLIPNDETSQWFDLRVMNGQDHCCSTTDVVALNGSEGEMGGGVKWEATKLGGHWDSIFSHSSGAPTSPGRKKRESGTKYYLVLVVGHEVSGLQAALRT